MKRCNHDRVYACRAEYDVLRSKYAGHGHGVVTAFFLVCVKCTKVRVHSRMYLGAFREWTKQQKESYPEGFFFTILAGPSGNEKDLKEVVVEAIQELAEKEKETTS